MMASNGWCAASPTRRRRPRRCSPRPPPSARAIEMATATGGVQRDTGQRPARAPGGSGTPRRRAIRREGLAGWAFSLPFLIIFVVFMAGPVLASFAMSFTDLRSRDLRNPLAVNPVGLDNYTRLLEDDTFKQASINTLYFVVVGVPLTMALGLAAAVG